MTVETPRSVYWLGDRQRAEETAHAQDVKGCVLFFDTQGQCINFMNWLTSLAFGERADE